MSTNSFFDGWRPQLVESANFVGDFDIPQIEALPDIVPLPKRLVRFDHRGSESNHQQWIHCYTYDQRFTQLVNHTEKYLQEIRAFDGFITPDCSLYRGAPLAVQIGNTYMNRAVGSYMQHHGIPVICNIRWADQSSYRFCFDGAPRNSTIACSNHGCYRSREDKYQFEAGFDQMMSELTPRRVILHGTPMPQLNEKYGKEVEIVYYPSDFAQTRRGF